MNPSAGVAPDVAESEAHLGPRDREFAAIGGLARDGQGRRRISLCSTEQRHPPGSDSDQLEAVAVNEDSPERRKPGVVEPDPLDRVRDRPGVGIDVRVPLNQLTM